MAAIHGTAAEIIGGLAQLFPQAFSTDPSKIRPLIVGLKKEPLQLCKRSPESLDDALRYYTGSVSYLNNGRESRNQIRRGGNRPRDCFQRG
jgi:sRNA-binding protein